MMKFKTLLIATITFAGIMATLLIRYSTQVKLRGNEVALQQQDNQLAEWMAEHQRLSNQIARAESSPMKEQMAELVRLRNQAASLRQQTNKLGRQRTENRLASAWQSVSGRLSYLLEHNREYYDPRASGKIDDAQTLGWALGKYAITHQGEFPSNLDQLTPFLPIKARPGIEPLTGTNQFELVYQGSRNELTNAPLREVVLIRERQAWLTPEGKWARVYGAADGRASIVESDDNFQSWETAHIVPPQTTSP
ncbi:MAG: polymerase, sigma-24 subunit, subfamily [Pedosphaera sp.]|nr:polymerase, sigma-24 subunit, subfamily [Pedosphaera sp.]